MKNMINILVKYFSILSFLCLVSLRAFATVVDNTNDNGAGSLRDAIENAAPNAIITFSSNVTGPIKLQSPLIINTPLTIDGTQTPGYNNSSNLSALGTPTYNPIIIIDAGSYFKFQGANSDYVAIQITTPGVILLGLRIQNAWQAIDAENFSGMTASTTNPPTAQFTVLECVLTACWTGIETDIPNSVIQHNFIGSTAANTISPRIMARGINIGLEDYYYQSSYELDDIIGEPTALATSTSNANIIQNCYFAGVEVYSGWGNLISANTIYHDVPWDDSREPCKAIRLIHLANNGSSSAGNKGKPKPFQLNVYPGTPPDCPGSASEITITESPIVTTDIFQLFKNTNYTLYGPENANSYIGYAVYNSPPGAWVFCFTTAISLSDIFTATAIDQDAILRASYLNNTSELGLMAVCPVPQVQDNCGTIPMVLSAIIPGSCNSCTYTWKHGTTTDLLNSTSNNFNTPVSGNTYTVTFTNPNSNCTNTSDPVTVY
jgi:hypothetical protein